MSFRKEPPFDQARIAETAVVLVNLGTPDAPTAGAVRRYLQQFLSDPRVIEIPKLLWWFILHGLILPFRSSKSAHKYAAIWSKDGSPLKVRHYGEEIALSVDEAVTRPIPPVKAGPRPTQPPGREPAARGVHARSTKAPE